MKTFAHIPVEMPPPPTHPSGPASGHRVPVPETRRVGARIRRLLSGLVATASCLLAFGLAPAVRASTAYGSLNNFDCVNDTGVEAHGFEIELDDIHSTDITYTYDYNHYGVPKITQDSTDTSHPKVFIRYAATRDSAGNWSAYTAIPDPAAPIAPTDGHQFTNPSVNFGGEHFGAGYYGAPTAVKYNWLIADGTGNLVHGPPVYVATPTFVYNPPVAAAPAFVQAIIVPPPPPALPPKQFGEATWVKAIKTTTHNAGKVALGDLVDPDPENPGAKDWANGEPAEIETEWKLLQTEFANADNPKGFLQGAAEDLPGGDEVITRRYEFYKYTGPFDAESGEAMADAVDADGIHGVGSVTFNDHIDPETGEWVTTTVDLSTTEVVGAFFGPQMAGFDVAPALGLIDHIPDGEVGVPYADRTVVIPGGDVAYHATTTGSLPDGTMLDGITGVFSGTPTTPGVFTFTVDARDLLTDAILVSKEYTVTIPGDAAVPATGTIATSSWPAAGGSTSGDGTFDNGTHVTVVAAHGVGYAFVNWTEGGVQVCDTAVYPFTVNGNRSLVANFVAIHTVSTVAAPLAGGTTGGDGTYNEGTLVTVTASPNPGYNFVDWTEAGVTVSASASYQFALAGNRSLVAHFVATHTVSTVAAPLAGGTTGGDGTYNEGTLVTVTASPNPGYKFVDWTEGGVAVSTSASYPFALAGNRSLVANFALKTPSLVLQSATAVRLGSKVDVTVVVLNQGDATAQTVAIGAKKDATMSGKAMAEHPPVLFGDIAPDGTAANVMTFNGLKSGTQTLQIRLTYLGGTTTLSTTVAVP